VRRAAPWLVQRYRYPHAHVELHFFRVLDGQASRSARRSGIQMAGTGRFDVAPLLPANTAVCCAR
jgi:8-oxo-dGTP diphosphatase